MTDPPTAAPTRCDKPMDFPPPGGFDRCDETAAEWRLTFHDWEYDEDNDYTYVQYEACVMSRNPYGACNPAGAPVALTMVFLQIPCLCEVCIEDVTKDMDPDGYATEIHQGWIWAEEAVTRPGQCRTLELTLRGYANMQPGTYKLFGGTRYTEGELDVPNPCEQAPPDYVPLPPLDIPESCEPRAPFFPQELCSFQCAYEHTEWGLEFVGRSYDARAGTSTFSYRAWRQQDNPWVTCNMQRHPQPLEAVYLRLGCQCTPDQGNFLSSITKAMQPFGVAEATHWTWYLGNDLGRGGNVALSLTLKGDLPASFGDFTVGGDGRCAHGALLVPDPCEDDCLFGQWTDWELWGQCSKDCGGGEQYRTRDCVSVCDLSTRVENCPGEGHGYVACNTRECADKTQWWRR